MVSTKPSGILFHCPPNRSKQWEEVCEAQWKLAINRPHSEKGLDNDEKRRGLLKTC